MPIKYLLLSTALLMLSCSNHSIKPQPSLLNKHRTNACQEELEQTIATLIHAQHLQLSRDVFSKNASLFLTNQKRNAFGSSPIINDLHGRKELLLYTKKQSLYVGARDKEGNILQSKQLSSCSSSLSKQNQ